ncbi:hypothetical protein CPB85DRAFT_1252599 [Mucidula mucida]|nr:hypothetical protein CPB85DRAFT_1252599 [Mucidula mucida]
MAQPTPRRPQSASSHAGGPMLPLPQQRAALRKTIPAHTVQTASPIAFLKRHCSLPELSSSEHDGLVAHVISELKERELLNDSGWPDTIIDGRTEGAIFKNLEPIVAAIGDICLLWDDEAQKLNDRTTTFECDGSNTTNSEVPGSSFMVDAQFILLERCTPTSNVSDSENDKADTVDISPSEFKKSVNDRADNEIKIASAANHTLFNDYSRRFVLGFTIEGVEMRFWHFSRSHIAVSPAFDYHQEPELFVRFAIFMTFADRIDLGYDPTVTRIRDANNKIQYQFEVDGKFYLTESFIAESAANDIVTRATRVWSVREYDPIKGTFIGSNSVVLKDVWLFSDAKGEKAIHDEIFAALKTLDDRLAAGTPLIALGLDDSPQVSLVEDAKPFFMDILQDVVVTFKRGDAQHADVAPAPESGYTPFSYFPGSKLRPAVLGKVPSSLRAELGTNEVPPVVEESEEIPATPIGDHPERTHRRIIFAHHCTQLYEVSDYADYALAMVHLLEDLGLNYLRLAGYVHRDISPGNCLVFKDPSSGKLQLKISDLEYARVYGADSSNVVPLTGTPGFMAIEYQCREHQFLPFSRTNCVSSSATFRLRDAPKTKLGPPVATQNFANTPWFRFNYLHDVESALWLYCWLLLHRLPESISDRLSASQCDSIGRYARELFGITLVPNGMRSRFMGSFLGHGDTFGAVVRFLTSLYGQDEDYGLSLLRGLDNFQQLATYYMQVEASTQVSSDRSFKWADKEFHPSFYRQLQSVFYDVFIALQGSQLQATRIRQVAPLKRVALAAAVSDEEEEEEEEEVFRALLDSHFVLERARQVGGEYLKPAKSETEQIENGRK